MLYVKLSKIVLCKKTLLEFSRYLNNVIFNKKNCPTIDDKNGNKAIFFIFFAKIVY